MAVTTNDDKGFFWNSEGGDRKYNANSMEKWLKKFFTTGVFTNDCQVTADGSSMKVNVSEGYANINGKVIFFEDSQELTVEMADATNPRIDAVVIERNDNNREIIAKVVTGTAAVSPVAPTPIRTDTVYQIVLAHIAVATGATVITQSNITSKRTDPLLCGIVTGSVANNQLTYGTQALTPGVSELPEGVFYFQYE